MTENESITGEQGHRRPSGGNERERLEVSSGQVVIADQFIFANPLLRGLSPADLVGKLREFGAVTVSLPQGSYAILRNPYEQKILVAPQSEELQDDFILNPDEMTLKGKVHVDTRCLIIFDAALLQDSEFLARFRELWASGGNGQKEARDLIREKGGAVRYGFSRQFEDLSVGLDTAGTRMGIWGSGE